MKHATLLGLFAATAAQAATLQSGAWTIPEQGRTFGGESSCNSAALAITAPGTYHCQKINTITVAAPVPPPPPPPPPSGAVSYSANFATMADTYPLSGVGPWVHANNAWTYIRVQAGVAKPTNGITNSYDDSYATLAWGLDTNGQQAAFGPVQSVEATIYRSESGGCGSATREVELWLHVADDTNNLRGYEADFPCDGTLQLGRWDGPFGDSSAIKNVPTVEVNYFHRNLVTGDVVKADITAAGVITMYVNGVPVLRGTDTTYTAGRPGIGAFLRPGAIGTFGFTSMRAWSQ
jgi:hypothetical protein